MKEDKSNVILLAAVLEDALQWSPPDMLRDAVETHKAKYPHIKKALVIFYDEDNPSNRSRIRWIQAGMKRSELLDVLSLAHNDIILDMFDSLAG